MHVDSWQVLRYVALLDVAAIIMLLTLSMRPKE